MTGQGCLASDGHDTALVGFAGAGAGSPSASLGGAHFVSNADSVEDLRGLTVCIGGSVGEIGTAGIDICAGITDKGELNGVFTVIVVGGAGLRMPVPGEGHTVFGYTGVTNLSGFFDFLDFFDGWGSSGCDPGLPPPTGTTTTTLSSGP